MFKKLNRAALLAIVGCLLLLVQGCGPDTLPDLIVENFEFTERINGDIYMIAFENPTNDGIIILNQGHGTATPLDYEITILDENGRRVLNNTRLQDSVDIRLAPGVSRKILQYGYAFTIPLSSFISGKSYRSRVTVNPNRRVPESNEGNNSRVEPMKTQF